MDGGNTAAAGTDSGNANPAYAFRYDASLGRYIYNLSTQELKSGQ